MIHLENENDFKKLTSTGKVLVDFFATWCGPCQMEGETLEKLSKENRDFQIVKVDVDKFPNIAKEFGVMSIPTLVVFTDGKLKKSNVGYLDSDGIIDLIS